MDDITTTQKAFSKIGWVYTAYSLAITVLQLVVVNVLDFVNPNALTLEIELLLSSGIMYVLGLIILPIGLKENQISLAIPEKKSMTIGAFFKALIMSYSLLILANLIGTLITTVISILKGSPIINPVEEIALNLDLPILILLTVILAPIFEELFFRKFLIDRTVQYGECVSMVISGFMFGIFHGNLSQFPYAFALGTFFAYIYIRTGKIGYTMLMHAIINFVGLSLLTIENLTGILWLLIYEMVVMTFVVIGIIWWILEFKKFYFKPTENAIPKGRCFETSILNTGMLVFIAFWFIMILIASM